MKTREIICKDCRKKYAIPADACYGRCPDPNCAADSRHLHDEYGERRKNPCHNPPALPSKGDRVQMIQTYRDSEADVSIAKGSKGTVRATSFRKDLGSYSVMVMFDAGAFEWVPVEHLKITSKTNPPARITSRPAVGASVTVAQTGAKGRVLRVGGIGNNFIEVQFASGRKGIFRPEQLVLDNPGIPATMAEAKKRWKTHTRSWMAPHAKAAFRKGLSWGKSQEGVPFVESKDGEYIIAFFKHAATGHVYGHDTGMSRASPPMTPRPLGNPPGEAPRVGDAIFDPHDDQPVAKVKRVLSRPFAQAWGPGESVSEVRVLGTDGRRYNVYGPRNLPNVKHFWIVVSGKNPPACAVCGSRAGIHKDGLCARCYGMKDNPQERDLNKGDVVFYQGEKGVVEKTGGRASGPRGHGPSKDEVFVRFAGGKSYWVFVHHLDAPEGNPVKFRTDYAGLARMLGNRDRKKVGNNRWLVRYGSDSIDVVLHRTNVLSFWADGRIILNSGGYKTVTTKAALNEFLPAPWAVDQTKGAWSIRNTETQKSVPFHDGIVIDTASGVIFKNAEYAQMYRGLDEAEREKRGQGGLAIGNPGRVRYSPLGKTRRNPDAPQLADLVEKGEVEQARLLADKEVGNKFGPLANENPWIAWAYSVYLNGFSEDEFLCEHELEEGEDCDGEGDTQFSFVDVDAKAVAVWPELAAKKEVGFYQTEQGFITEINTVKARRLLEKQAAG